MLYRGDIQRAVFEARKSEETKMPRDSQDILQEARTRVIKIRALISSCPASANELDALCNAANALFSLYPYQDAGNQQYILGRAKALLGIHQL